MVCIILFYFDSMISLFTASIFFRRALLVPAELNFQYFDFFSQYPYVYWANNFFTFGLIDYPYDIPSAKIIGEFAYNSYETSANTGWIGSGFMQAGYIGLFIYSLIIGFVIAFIDALSHKINTGFCIAFIMIPMLTLFTSSDLPTTFITHGLLFALVIIIYLCLLYTSPSPRD